MNRIILAAGIAVIAVCLCCGSPFTGMLTVEKPNAFDLVGVYEMSGQSLDRSATFPDRHPEIVIINEDSTCSVTDFPVWELENSSWSVIEWLSFEGTWAMGEYGSVQRGNEHYRNWAVGCGNNAEGMNVTGELTNHQPPYDLLFIYDDPDSGYGMSFEKIP
jgi:hypothetical protein